MPALTPLFHPQHVQAVADRLGHANWDFLQSESFRKGLEDIERKRLTGEANTREKIIEPILYEVLGLRPQRERRRTCRETCRRGRRDRLRRILLPHTRQ